MDKMDNPDAIELYRMKVLLQALKLEMAGMKRHGRSAYSIIKFEHGLKGNRRSVLVQFRDIIKEKQSALLKKSDA